MRRWVLASLLLLCTCTAVESMTLGALPSAERDASDESDEDASEDDTADEEEEAADLDALRASRDGALDAADAGSDVREGQDEEEDFHGP